MQIPGREHALSFSLFPEIPDRFPHISCSQSGAATTPLETVPDTPALKTGHPAAE